MGKEIRCIEGEIPFEIPEGWEWCRLGSFFTMQAGKNIQVSKIFDVSSQEHEYLCYGGNGIRGFVNMYNREGSYPLIGRQGALCGNIKHASGKFYATVTCCTPCKYRVKSMASKNGAQAINRRLIGYDRNNGSV